MKTTISPSRTVCRIFLLVHFVLEKLIRHMIKDSPEAVGLGAEELGTGEGHTLADKIKLVFMKNGIPPNANPQLVGDLVKLLEAEPRK
jgi:hypothetical protein